MKDVFSFVDKIEKLRSDGLGSSAIKTDINNKFGTEFSRNDIEKVFRQLDKPAENDFEPDVFGNDFNEMINFSEQVSAYSDGIGTENGPAEIAEIMRKTALRTAVLIALKYELFEAGQLPAPPISELKFLSDLIKLS